MSEDRNDYTSDEALRKRALEIKRQRPNFNITQIVKEMDKEGYSIKSIGHIDNLLIQGVDSDGEHKITKPGDINIIQDNNNKNIIDTINYPPKPQPTNNEMIPAVITIVGFLGLFVFFLGGLVLMGLGIFLFMNSNKEVKESQAAKIRYEQALVRAQHKILEANRHIPKEKKLVMAKKGLVQLEEYLQRKKVACQKKYVWMWREQKDIIYTYAFDKVNDSHIPRFYLSTEGEIKNSILDKADDTIPIFRITEKDFFFYSREGDFYVKNNVSGSGGGTDYGGAVVGGALFGGAGAIVASRKEVNIKTTTSEVDRRDTILYYKYKDELIEAYFASKDYKTFKELFPYKDSAVMDKMSKLEPNRVESTMLEAEEDHKLISNGDTKEDDVYTKIIKLGDLLSKGYITQEEFDEKKKKILELL